MAAKPFLMFQEGTANEAIQFYTQHLPNSKVVKVEHYPEGDHAGWVKTAVVEICGLSVMVIDSPIKHQFDFTPSMSLFVTFDSEEAVQEAYSKLSEGAGGILMPLDSYDFSKKYAWIKDKFGVSWQLNLE